MKREENLILARYLFPNYFLDLHEFNDFMETWLTYKEFATDF